MSLSLLLALAMTGVWCLVIGELSLGQVLLGLTFGSLFVLVTGAGRGQTVPVIQLPVRLAYLSVYLVVLIPYGIARSNLDLAWRLLRLKPDIRPGIIRVQLGPLPEATSALVAHAITMSPGQMVVDYSPDGSTMYVHLIDASQAEIKQISFWRIYHSVLGRIFA